MSTRNDVEIKHITGPFARKVVGTTPLKLELPPGIYCVGVQLDVASENIQFSLFDEDDKSEEHSELDKMFTGSNILEKYVNFGISEVGLDIFGNPASYLQDGNRELWTLYNKGHLKKVGKIYEIEKVQGKPATLIALFQRHNEDPDKVYNMLPPEYRFNEREMVMPLLLAFHVSKKESKQFHKRILRGGKALLYDSKVDHFMAELKPIEIKVSENKETTSGGCTMSFMGKYLGSK